MSFYVTDAFVQQFTGTLRMLAQQMDSRLRNTVLEDQVTGEAAYMEQLAPTVASKLTTRHAATPLVNIQHARRRLAPYPYVWATLVDREDKVRLLIDPVSGYTQAGAMSMRRAYDDEIIAAFFATAYTGHTGTTQVVWPAGNSEVSPTLPAGYVVAINSWAFGAGSGNSGMTVSKIIEAGMALDAAEGDENEERFLVLRAKDKANLLATTEVTSSEYSDVQALKTGKLKEFMGFTIIHSEHLLYDGSGYARIPAWRKSGMGIGIARDIEGIVNIRPDRNNAWQPYADEDIGASRLEEPKVVEIKCLP